MKTYLLFNSDMSSNGDHVEIPDDVLPLRTGSYITVPSLQGNLPLEGEVVYTKYQVVPYGIDKEKQGLMVV